MDILHILVLIVILALIAYIVYTLSQLTTKANAVMNQLNAYARQKAATAEDNGRSALKLQAYERLSLLMERMAVQNMLLRQPAGTMTSQQYTASLLFTIREEFEHNVTQQVYVSDQLWLILLQARDNVSQLIVRAAEGAESGQQVANRLLHMSQNQPSDPVALAQSAIRRESSSV
jgi:predicted lactoylglutathione lyase